MRERKREGGEGLKEGEESGMKGERRNEGGNEKREAAAHKGSLKQQPTHNCHRLLPLVLQDSLARSKCPNKSPTKDVLIRANAPVGIQCTFGSHVRFPAPNTRSWNFEKCFERAK